MPPSPQHPHDHTLERAPRYGCDDVVAVGLPGGSGSSRYSVTLSGEIDLVTKPCLTRALDRFRASSHSDVTVDLTGATFIDTTCLTFLALLRRAAAAKRGAVVIRGAVGSPRRTLAIVGFDSIFDVVN